MTLILGVDPGGTTGLAYLESDWPNQLPVLSQLGPHMHHAELEEFMFHVLYPDVVVCEDFKADLLGANLISVEYIGVLRLWCSKTGTPFILQRASTGKDFWTDDKLKTVGVYEKGAPHARDALRHLLHYITFTLGDQSWLQKLK